MAKIITKYNIVNAYLSGGCFLNVKLNKFVLDNINGYICVNPLSGDQGAAIGMYRNYTRSRFNFDDLCFGPRDKIKFADATMMMFAKEGIIVKNSDREVIDSVSNLLQCNYIVNVIRGNMEFGPRALCNTSTLALPNAANAAYINKVNNRNEVMPMAPVMRISDSAHLLSSGLSRVIGSNMYMIITHDYEYTNNVNEFKHRGVLHNKPLDEGFTCRPQVVHDQDSVIYGILTNVNTDHKCLINTSFNTHGTPILYSFSDAIEDFRKQKINDSEGRLILILQIND